MVILAVKLLASSLQECLCIYISCARQEDYTKLTKEEQNNILKYSNRSISNLIKCLHINDKLPQYKNICIKNLRGKGRYLFENNKWNHLNYDVLLIMLFNRKFSDLNKILDENNNEAKRIIITSFS